MVPLAEDALSGPDHDDARCTKATTRFDGLAAAGPRLPRQTPVCVQVFALVSCAG
jgi:hypothetical protein